MISPFCHQDRPSSRSLRCFRSWSPAAAGKARRTGRRQQRLPQHPARLQKAVNDARAMGDTLRQLGFTVMAAENQTRKGFTETLLAFDQIVELGDTTFFFLPGTALKSAARITCCPRMSKPPAPARRNWCATAPWRRSV